MSAPISQLLQTMGGLDDDRVEECLRLRSESGQSLDKILLQKGYLDEPAVLELFAAYLGYDYYRVDSVRIHGPMLGLRYWF